MNSEIRIDLFPGSHRLTGLAYGAFVGFAITGVVMTFLTAFVLTLELLTSPSVRGGWRTLGLVGVVLTCTLVVLECRAAGPISAKRWAVFALCVTDVALHCWFILRDPVAKQVFTTAAVVGAIFLFVGRLMIHFEAWVAEQPAFNRSIMFLVGWSGVAGIVGMWFI